MVNFFIYKSYNTHFTVMRRTQDVMQKVVELNFISFVMKQS
jgi:hypothetical protein